MAELNAHALFVLLLIGIALVLFATERIKLEATAFLVLVVLLAGFALVPFSPDTSVQAFQASSLLSVFGNEALIAVCALMILGKGVETTDALNPLVTLVSRHWSARPRLTMLAVLLGAAVMSAFLNNTPIVVVMLPVLISIAQKNHVSPSNLLMPIGLATIIGGMATTIGTSTNLLVVGLAEQIAGLHIALFDLVPYVATAGAAGLVYLWLVAPAITPERTGPRDRDGDERIYMATVVLDQASMSAAGTVAELLEATRHRVAIDRIQHRGETFRRPLPSLQLHAGDHVYVRGTRAALRDAELALKVSLTRNEEKRGDDPELEPQLVELLVTERSELDGRSLANSQVLSLHGIAPVALHRPAQRERSRRALDRIRLRSGDMLLCEGTREQFNDLLNNSRLLALSQAAEVTSPRRGWIALAIVVGVIACAALELLPIAISAIAGIGVMRATKCLAWRHIGQSLSTQVVLVIVVSLALGQALMVTGGDRYVASGLASLLAGQPPEVVIPSLMLIMAAITNVVSNNAAAVIGTPIGLQLAAQLGIPPMPMVLAVLFGANLSFATPIGYQTNLLVFSAGGYRFTDFLRVGLPLTLIMWAILSLLLVVAFV